MGSGRFVFADLMPGSYTLAVTHVAYDAGQRAVRVVEMAEVFIALSHKDASAR